MATTARGDDSFSPSSSVDESTILEEVEILEAIYINELTLEKDDSGRPTLITLLLHPATGDNVDEQFVCLTLEFRTPLQYPMVIPDITIRNPRGLADEHVQELRESLNDLSEERRGGPMLYELIELAKESLTQGNTPHGQCVICLEHFSLDDIFTKTECYHYFHCSCLLRYVNHCLEEQEAEEQEARRHRIELPEKKMLCPVCRESIAYDKEILEHSQQPLLNEDEYQLGEDIRVMQKKMAALFEKQKANGGIIDLEFEKNKFLLPAAPLNVESKGMVENVQLADMVQTLPVTSSMKSEPQHLLSYGQPGQKNASYNRDNHKHGIRDEGKRRERDRWGRGKRNDNLRFGGSGRETQSRESRGGSANSYRDGGRGGKGRGYRGARRGDGGFRGPLGGGGKEGNPYRDKHIASGTREGTANSPSQTAGQQDPANGHSSQSQPQSALRPRGNKDGHSSNHDSTEFNLYKKSCSENNGSVQKFNEYGDILLPVESSQPPRRPPPGFRARGPPPGFNRGYRKPKPSSVKPELQEDR